jgi:hypothetical protein
MLVLSICNPIKYAKSNELFDFQPSNETAFLVTSWVGIFSGGQLAHGLTVRVLCRWMLTERQTCKIFVLVSVLGDLDS